MAFIEKCSNRSDCEYWLFVIFDVKYFGLKFCLRERKNDVPWSFSTLLLVY